MTISGYVKKFILNNLGQTRANIVEGVAKYPEIADLIKENPGIQTSIWISIDDLWMNHTIIRLIVSSPIAMYDGIIMVERTYYFPAGSIIKL